MKPRRRVHTVVSVRARSPVGHSGVGEGVDGRQPEAPQSCVAGVIPHEGEGSSVCVGHGPERHEHRPQPLGPTGSAAPAGSGPSSSQVPDHAGDEDRRGRGRAWYTAMGVTPTAAATLRTLTAFGPWWSEMRSAAAVRRLPVGGMWDGAVGTPIRRIRLPWCDAVHHGGEFDWGILPLRPCRRRGTDLPAPPRPAILRPAGWIEAGT